MYGGEYKGAGWLLIAGAGVSVAVVGVSWWLTSAGGEGEERTVYESGIMPYGDVRVPYRVGIVLVGVLIMLIDVEVAYMYPWGMVIGQEGSQGYMVGMGIMAIVTGGLGYE